MAVAAGLFKKYDIRGVAMGDDAPLTTAAAHKIGCAIGTFFRRRHGQERVVVGRDNRLTSDALRAALVEGLISVGMRVIDIGVVSTPLVYWYAVQQDHCAAVMITGSHLTPEYNGFKLSVGAVNIFGDDIQAIRHLAEQGDFETGQGTVSTKDDVIESYSQDIASRIAIDRQLKVVIDPGNGTGGLIAPRLLDLWQQDASGIYLEPDGNFPNHLPNPQDADNVRELGQRVVEVGANVGIAFDGDADRMGAVDERGNLIAADRILALLAQDMLTRHAGTPVVADVLSSQALFDAIESAGGKPVMAPSGHSLVKDAMRAESALLGGEMSGHLFFGEDYYGFDDGFFAMGRLLQLLARTNKPLSELDDALPRYYSTPEYRPHCPDEHKTAVIAGVGEKLADAGRIVSVDGVRVQFDHGWGIIRASNTEPVLSLRFEGKTESHALAYQQMFFDALAAYPMVERL